MATITIDRIKRAFQKPPHVVARRLVMEFNRSIDRFLVRTRSAEISPSRLLRATESDSIDALWHRLANRNYVTPAHREADGYSDLFPGGETRILGAAEKAASHYVDLLGSGDVYLGRNIDWHRDYKTDHSWPGTFSLDIDYANPDRPSDVKFPWELSRMQWLIPAGQAYCLTGDNHYAAVVRGMLENWMNQNPCKLGVNWACTMEVAMRLQTWTWFFHVFQGSLAWNDAAFRSRFLCCLFSHARFTEQYLEYSDVNGNHCTADATALVFAGLFFGECHAARRWHKLGWRILCDEIEKQVFADGVDFEASTAYHRLVLELFFLAARYRESLGNEIPQHYRDRVIAMARFVRAYARPDGTIPLWGDADDGRALPFGDQPTNDHRYLVQLIGSAWGVDDLIVGSDKPSEENYWLNGPIASLVAKRTPDTNPVTSQSFSDGGFYIMRNDRDHVFIDCGPVGLAGRGGHGHNDCLSFEAMLDGTHLITDCGSYVYTASYDERNRFRATACHNTPQIDGQEMNRFVADENLWQLHDDAQPNCQLWRSSSDIDIFRGSHSGYERLDAPVTPTRTIVLDHGWHTLVIADEIRGDGRHRVCVPLHLAPSVTVELQAIGQVALRGGGQDFELSWSDCDNWKLEIEPCRVSPTYGVAIDSVRLVWRYHGRLPVELMICIAPARRPSDDVHSWARACIAEI